MQRIPEAILKAGTRLFWDVDVATLDPSQHEDFILGRVLSEGTTEMVRALRDEVGDSALRAFLLRAPHRLDRRTRRFLEVVLAGVDAQEPTACTTTPFRRNSDGLFSP
jgi:hypothetical protein